MPWLLPLTALPGTLASAASADRLAASFVFRVLFSALEVDSDAVNSVIFCCNDEIVASWFSIFFSSFGPSLAREVWAVSSAFSSEISSLDAAIDVWLAYGGLFAIERARTHSAPSHRLAF